MTTTIPAPLKDKVALVTGGAKGGLGAGIAETLARQGCSHIAITYHSNEAKTHATLATIKELSPNAVTAALYADLLDPDFASKTVTAALKALGTDRLDIIVHNAGLTDIENFRPLSGITKDWWDERMTGETWAPLSLAREGAAVMPPGGRIIMISAGLSRVPVGEPMLFLAAGKSAVEAMVRYLGVAFVPKGITVNSISVGSTATEKLEAGHEIYGEEHRKMAADFSVMKRIASVEEVANIVAFVASPQASWLTSNSIPANGGALCALQG